MEANLPSGVACRSSAAFAGKTPFCSKRVRNPINQQIMQVLEYRADAGRETQEIMEVPGISGGGEDLRTELLNADPELLRRICVARGKDRIRSLRQFRPVYQELPPPSKTNTRFFLTRSSCDWSIIKSIRGDTVVDAAGYKTVHQVWASHPHVNKALQDAFNSCHHVIMLMLYYNGSHRSFQFYGGVRPCSIPSASLYGDHGFWPYEPAHAPHFNSLGANMKVQWLFRCQVNIDDCVRRFSDVSNHKFLLPFKDGHEFTGADHEWAWNLVEDLLSRGDEVAHELTEPERKTPSEKTKSYEQSVRKREDGYFRGNPHIPRFRSIPTRTSY